MTLPKDPEKAKEYLLGIKLFRLLYHSLGQPGSMKGRISSLRGRSYTEIHGEEKGKALAKRHSSSLMGHAVSENVRKISALNLGRKGVPARNKGIAFSETARKRMSSSKLALILTGSYHPQNNRFKAIKSVVTTKKAGLVTCLGAWEVSYVEFLENNPLVVSFAKDTVRLGYSYLSKTRVYIVDFLVVYSCGKRELVEIKPSDLLNKEENPDKFEAARRWCLTNNASFVIITEKEIAILK